MIAGATSALATTPSSTLEAEAAQFCDQFKANAAKVTSFRADTQVSVQLIDAASRATSATTLTAEHHAWRKADAKLRWSTRGAGGQGYVADVPHRTMLVLQAGATVLADSLTADQLDRYGHPAPRWLWEPARLLPAHPAGIQLQGDRLLLTSSTRNPIRRVWFDVKTGRLAAFADTDATGHDVRRIECKNWGQVSGVWMPQEIDERVVGVKGGFTRVTRFSGIEINGALSATEFVLP